MSARSTLFAVRSGVLAIGLAGVALTNGCTGNGQSTSKAARSAVASPSTAAAFDNLKSLEGEWTMVDENGQRVVASVFEVSSNGSVVREIMFPGTPHEMTNMYHLDGDSIVATHYCAIGNQPRMRCVAPASGVYAFEIFDCTNLSAPNAEHMADLTLSILGPNSICESWRGYKPGAEPEAVVIDLTRS